jgi:hypothetical protein
VAATEMWVVVPPVILLVGTVGNIMTLIIFHKMRREKNRGSSSSHSMTYFFSCLAISDLLLLYTGLLRRWLMYIADFDIR